MGRGGCKGVGGMRRRVVQRYKGVRVQGYRGITGDEGSWAQGYRGVGV